MKRHHLLLVAGLALGATPAAENSAWAQARVIVAPSAAVGLVYDDNIFSAPKDQATQDMIWRLTPGFSASRETARTTWFGSYSFDAERFTDHSELTTPLARQVGSMLARFLPDSGSALILRGDYDNTITPAELNLTTGLQTGRQRAWRWQAGPEFTQAVTPRTRIGVAYSVSAEFLDRGQFHPTDQRLLTYTADLKIAHDVTPRDEVRVKPFLDTFHFNDSADVMSYGGVLGWTHKITPLTSLSLDAGPRVVSSAGLTSLRPEVDFLLARRTVASDVSLEYARTLTTAVGLAGTIETDRVVAAAGYHQPRWTDFTISGGFYNNIYADNTARVLRVSTDLTQTIIGVFAVGVSYSLDFQQGRLGVLLADGTTLAGSALLAAPQGEPLMRNVLVVRIVIAPQIRPTGKLREPPRQTLGNVTTVRSVR